MNIRMCCSVPGPLSGALVRGHHGLENGVLLSLGPMISGPAASTRRWCWWCTQRVPDDTATLQLSCPTRTDSNLYWYSSSR